MAVEKESTKEKHLVVYSAAHWVDMTAHWWVSCLVVQLAQSAENKTVAMRVGQRVVQMGTRSVGKKVW